MYYINDKFINWLFTIVPSEDVTDKITEVVPSIVSFARTFTSDEIEKLVDEFGENKVLKLPVLIEEFGKSWLADILDAAMDWPIYAIAVP